MIIDSIGISWVLNSVNLLQLVISSPPPKTRTSRLNMYHYNSIEKRET